MGSTAPTAVGYGPGIDASTVTVGFTIKDNGAAANAAVGAAGVTTGDEQHNFQIVIDDVNAHGGIAGRKVIPVFHHLDANSTASNDQLVAQTCADWTQDHHIFLSATGGDAGLLSCLDKAKVATAYDNLGVSSPEIFQRYRYYAEISLVNLGRLATDEVSALAGQNWFSPWDATSGAPGGTGTKVGVITYDNPAFRSATSHNLLPALTRAGHPAVDTIYVHAPNSKSELSATSSDIANAQLKFRQHGIEHVVLYDSGGTLTLLFLNAAQSQGYFPRYGFNSQSAPQILLTGGDVPAQQLKGSVGLGWLPMLDLRLEDNPDNGPYSNPARRACLALFRAHQVTFPDANAKAVALLACNTLYFMKATIERGVRLRSGPINRDTYLLGLNAMGSTFQSAMTFDTTYSAAQHDGASAGRAFSFQAGCKCMRYVGGLLALQ